VILVDTNVLVYSLDPADLAKQRIAIDFLDGLNSLGQGAVSVQCMTEFFNAVTRKIAQPLPGSAAADHVADIAASFMVLDLTSAAVVEACRVVTEWQMSIWDALIWSVAHMNGIITIATEDMQHRSTIAGILYLNPFAEGFDLSTALDANRGP
jgi:predicted nucleic acid-binding protein